MEMFQPFKPEKIYSRATREAKIIGFSPSISPEMVRLLELLDWQENETLEDYLKRILKTLESPKKFPQIAPEVKEFLRETIQTFQEKPEYYDEEELKALLLVLLSTPSPAEQKRKLEENKELLLKEARKIKKVIPTIVLIEISLKKVKPEVCLSFFAAITPEERQEYRQWIENSLNSLKKADPASCLHFFAAITPKERQEYRQWIENSLNSLKKADPASCLSFFAAITPEERQEYQPEIRDSLNKAKTKPEVCLSFFAAITPEERTITTEEGKEYRQWIENSLNKADPASCLSFFAAITPKERQEYQKKINGCLSKAGVTDRFRFYGAITQKERKERHIEIKFLLNYAAPSDRLLFYAAITPEERQEYQKEIVDSLMKVGPGNRLDFFSAITPEERSISPLTKKLSQRFITELTSEIGDLVLREKYFALLLDYLGKETSSLIALNNLYIPRKKLALALGLAFLGADPLPALSWQLKPQEYLDLLYSLSRLAEKEENRGLFEGLILPFRPRGREVAGFEKSLVEWIRFLDFLNSLGDFLDSREILIEHLNWIKERQKKEGIETTSPARFSFLKEIAQELKRIKTKVKENFQKLLGLETLDPEKFEKFIKNWQGEIESILVLAQRLHQSYPEVKKLLAQIGLAVIDDRWLESRYNLGNPLTREQLGPLIEGKNQEEIENIILAYHQGVKFIFEEERGKETVSQKTIFSPPEELKESLKENLLTHQHFQEIFTLKEFQSLNEEEKDLIERYVLSIFFKKEKIPLETSDDLFEYFKNKIPQEILDVLVDLHLFFKDLLSGQKSSRDLLDSLKTILKTIREKIPEAENLAFIQDLEGWLKAEIKARARPKEIKPQKRTLLVHTTDHPKTLLEIGKYPLNSGSCQSYDYSDLKLAVSLLGYVFDSHIQAVVIREIETEEDISEIILIDEGKRKAKVKTKDGKIIEVQISRPIARAMFFLGEKKGQGVFILQRNYHQPGVIETNLAQELEQKALSQLIEKLNNYGLNLRLAKEGERGITIAGSHNPEGHYNDIAGGQRGQKGISYTI